MTDADPTRRFTDRAKYARYRPAYPTAVLECLRHECGLSDDIIVANRNGVEVSPNATEGSGDARGGGGEEGAGQTGRRISLGR